MAVELSVVGGVVSRPVVEIVELSDTGRLGVGVMVASGPVDVEFESPVVIGDVGVTVG